MGQRFKPVFPADLLTKRPDLLTAELDDPPGNNADQIVIRLPAGDHLIVGLAVIEKHLLEDPRVLKVAQRPVNGSAAHAMAGMHSM